MTTTLVVRQRHLSEVHWWSRLRSILTSILCITSNKRTIFRHINCNIRIMRQLSIKRRRTRWTNPGFRPALHNNRYPWLHITLPLKSTWGRKLMRLSIRNKTRQHIRPTAKSRHHLKFPSDFRAPYRRVPCQAWKRQTDFQDQVSILLPKSFVRLLKVAIFF